MLKAPKSEANTATQRNAGQGRRATSAKHDGNTLIDTKAAAAMLGIKPQTLYSYVSRGLIRTAPGEGKKGGLYHREDIEALRLRGRGGNASGAAVERVIRWGGGAVLQTAITSIGPLGPRYRGKLAVDLASAQRSFEQCVELLWNGLIPPHAIVWPAVRLPATFNSFTASLVKIAKQTNSRQMFSLLVETYAACIGRNPELAFGAPVLAARSMVQILAPGLGLLKRSPRYQLSDKPESIAATIARYTNAPRNNDAVHAINSCLILSADHELAPSTFATRIAASAGADIFSCVNSALGAFEGLLTGRGCDESELLLGSAKSPLAYINKLKEYSRRKEIVPGYCHPLYPEGDPRASFLLDMARNMTPNKAASARVLSCIDAASSELGLTPSLAVGLVAISTSLGLPERSPGALMALGRTAGWIANAFEQRLAGYVVRPRARYIGPSE